tara:strand:- start:1999 stop:2187 length:189 start_codon:yes stop_codon:yes gene_type:complete
MQTTYEDGFYWTHSTFGPSVRAAWRKVEIRNGAVGVIEADQPEHWFDQPFFFAVNTMVGKAD